MRYVLPLLAAGLLATAGPASAHNTARQLDDSIWVGSHGTFTNWRPVARDELVVWASPSRAYLVKIWRPFTGPNQSSEAMRCNRRPLASHR